MAAKTQKALLCVSFGTSVPKARNNVEAVENALGAAAPDRDFVRAFTSPTIRRILAERGYRHRGAADPPPVRGGV